MDGAEAARRAAVRLITARVVSVAAGFVGLVVLARLLEPDDFGVYAMALAVYGVAHTVVSGGFLKDAIRRADPMPDGTLALAAAMSLALSVPVALAVVGLGAALPPRFRPDGFLAVLMPMLAALPLVGLTLQREARLHRAVAFDVPAIAQVAGVVVEIAVAAALAWSGKGAASLAWGFAAGAGARSVVLLSAPGPGRGRRARPRLDELRDLTRFGLRMTWVDLLPKVANLAVLSALTGLAGAAATGVYNRAARINQMINDGLLEGLRPMMLPVISAAMRSGLEPAAVLARKHEFLMPIAFAGFGAIALLAEPLVAVLLGPGWEAVVGPVRILTFAGLTMPIVKMSQKVFVAMGRLDAYSRIQTRALVLRVILCIAGAAVSTEAFCVGLVTASMVKAAMILSWEARHAGAPPADLQRPAAHALAVAAATLALPAALVWFDPLPPAATLVLSMVWALPIWLIALHAIKHPIAAEIDRMIARWPLPRGLRLRP